MNYADIFIGLLSFFFIIQIYYYLRYFSAVTFYKIPENNASKKLPISVIIAARNEADNLQEFLDSVLTQDYPNYEVIVVNDCSYDNSEDILKGFQSRYPHLKVVELEEDDKYRHGKKFALTIGIKAAVNEHLLFTDADCMPVSKNWITHMQQGFSEGKEIVLGNSPFIKTRGFMNAFSRFETFFTALQFLSFSLKRNSYMGVGRNLAYTKSLFFKGKGFAAHMHLQSGDDDLFVNQNATKENVAVCMHPDSFVMSPSKKSWSEYFSQKVRHLRDGKEYKKSHQYSLSLISISALCYYIVLTLSFAFQLPYIVSFGFLGARFLMLGLFYFSSMRKLGTRDLFLFYFIFDIIYLLVIPFWALISFFTKEKKWK